LLSLKLLRDQNLQKRAAVQALLGEGRKGKRSLRHTHTLTH
jgi:hypothetical protein